MLKSILLVMLVGVCVQGREHIKEEEEWDRRAPSQDTPIEHVHLVDVYDVSPMQQNMLFRGGDPDQGHDYAFSYDLLVQSMQIAAQEAGYQLPPNFYLIDLDFLNDYDGHQPNRNNGEFTYFQENPDKGEYIFWETHGQYDDPIDPDLPSDFQTYMSKTYPTWGQVPVAWRVEKMREYLTQKNDIPVVIYGHCLCGCDRTGEMFGSYSLKWLGDSWKNVSETDEEIAGREISCGEYLGMQWYCFYLKNTDPHNFGHLDCQKSYQPDCNDDDDKRRVQRDEEEEKRKIDRQKRNEKISLPASDAVENVYYVDSVTLHNKNQNFLFRGGDPDTKGYYEFNYDAVVDAMQAAAKDAGETLPKNFTLIDVTTIGTHTGHDVYRSSNEYAYFQSNPSQGEFWFWECYGEGDDPRNRVRLQDRFDQMIADYKTWSHDLLTFRVDVLIDTLKSDNNTLPIVIFAHDREGYHEISDLMGAYMLQGMNKSWEDINSINKSIAGGDVPCDYYFATQWYCYYLQGNIKGYSHLDCDHEYQSKCHDD